MIEFFAGSPQDARLYRRLLGYVAPYRGMLIASLLAMLVLAVADAGKAAILKPMLDGAFIGKDPELMTTIPFYLILLFIVSGIAMIVAGSALHWVANSVVLDIRAEMFARLLELPSRFYDTRTAGSLVSKFTYDVIQIKEATTSALTVMIKDAFVVIGLLAWMFYLDWRMTLITLVGGPFIMIIAVTIRRRLRKMSKQVQQTMGDMTSIVDESIGAHRIIKLFAGQHYETGKFNRVAEANRKYTMKFVNASVASGPAIQLIAAIALAVIIYYASSQAANGQLTVGTFVSFFAALVMMLDALRRLVKVNEFIQKGLAACESVFELLDEPTEHDTGTRQFGVSAGAITIEHLGFSYDGINLVLDDINLDIKPGETIALVGASGSGKTTLANLIPRFYQHSTGTIRIDGQDICNTRLSSLRSGIALVSQDIVLFNDTVRNNIAYGSMKDATDAEVQTATRSAHALDFIEKLPEGMQTMLGENGARLSGGQRQRIALARALLKNAPVLLLDEATSALDAESERNIQQALEEIRHRHTCIIIAHRLTTIESADRIVVLANGRIVESGSHSELIRNNGPYSRLYTNREVMFN